MRNANVTEIPERLRDELRGEMPLFVVREPLAITQAGANGARVVAVAMLVVAGVIGVLQAPAGPEDRAFLATATMVGLGALGIAFLVAASLLRRRPGGFVVGTSTRLLRTWMFGIASEPWREFKEARLEPDGSISLVRRAKASSFRPPDDIVEPPGAAAIIEMIRERLGVLQQVAEERANQAAEVRAALADYAFATTHRPGLVTRTFRRVSFAVGLLLLGGLMTIMNPLIVGTMTVSVDGGPSREVDASDPIAWLPTILGIVLIAGGATLLLLMRPRQGEVRYLMTEEALHVRAGAEDVERIPWSEFTGEVERVERRGRVDLRFPLHLEHVGWGKGGTHREQVVLHLAGVPKADETQHAFRQRIERG